jgi:ABC-type uncharacterized transport system involved in gliding motility auxiliary subunit
MQKGGALAGILGLVLLAFGILDYFIAAGSGHFFVLINLVGGVFALVLWATTASRESLGALFGSRSTRYGTNATIYTVVFIALLVAVNYLASTHSRRLDTTQEKIFSLSPQSVKVVESLKEPVKFYGFFQGGQNQRAQQLYEAYHYASPKVSYELVDPDRHPELAQRFKVSLMGTTRVQYGNDDQAGSGTNVTELSEENLTNAILKVTRGGSRTVYFLDGEGEADPDDTKASAGFGNFSQALQGEGYQVKKLLLAAKPAVPEDCSLLVIAGPTREITPHVIDAIDAYFKRGGNGLVMFRPPGPDGDPETPLVQMVGRDWGVFAGNDVIVDQVLRLFAGPALGLNPIVDDYDTTSAITHSFNQRTVFPETRSLTLGQGRAGLTVFSLAKTSSTSFAETDLKNLYEHQTATMSATALKGPITVASSVQGYLETLGYAKAGMTRLVVMGSTDFANNQYFNQFYNRDFIMNAADWLVGEEKAISIRPRSLHASSFRLTVAQFSVVFALSVLLLPEVLLLLGIAVWWQRRT